MSKTAWVAWAVKNIAVLVCFTVLAVYFGKWWIIFFAYFFTTTFQTERKTVRSTESEKETTDHEPT